MDNFNTYINGIDFNAFRDFCREHGKIERLHKGELFVRRGTVSYKWGYITKGHFAYTIVDSSGEQKTVGFAFCDSFIGSYPCMINGQNSPTDIVALTDAEVKVCGYYQYQELLTSNDQFRAMLAESIFDDAYGRYLRLYNMTPKERYLRLINQCPELLEYITLKQLASYIQITPTYLSRIRKETTDN